MEDMKHQLFLFNQDKPSYARLVILISHHKLQCFSQPLFLYKCITILRFIALATPFCMDFIKQYYWHLFFTDSQDHFEMTIRAWV